MAEFLMDCIRELNWLVAFEIASFAAESFQRDVYFKCEEFEKIVNNSYRDGVSITYPSSDRFYQGNVEKLHLNKHSGFPNPSITHRLYSKKPYLPLIRRGDRVINELFFCC